MSATKIIGSLKEALAFARGDCGHDWKIIGANASTLTKWCPHCGVRITEYAGVDGRRPLSVKEIEQLRKGHATLLGGIGTDDDNSTVT